MSETRSANLNTPPKSAPRISKTSGLRSRPPWLNIYFELRGQDALQDVYNRTIEADRKALELTRALVETGIDSPEATAQAEVTLQNAEATGIGIATNRAIYEHAIATLIGKPASSFSMPVKNLTTPVPAIPVGVPSQLLQRRPDIAASERTMAQANAIIGVEKAAYYPTLSLTGSRRSSSFRPSRSCFRCQPSSGRWEPQRLKSCLTPVCVMQRSRNTQPPIMPTSQAIDRQC